MYIFGFQVERVGDNIVLGLQTVAGNRNSEFAVVSGFKNFEFTEEQWNDLMNVGCTMTAFSRQMLEYNKEWKELVKTPWHKRTSAQQDRMDLISRWAAENSIL